MKTNPKIKILVACHKADPNIRQDEIYMPIQVGKALHPELDLGFQTDNTGENISEKNGSYCELTALYWAWKNLKEVDYIGLAHYRRYLKINNADLSNLIRQDLIIMAAPHILSNSVFDGMVHWTSLEDATIFINTILELYPEYKNDVVSYYFNNNHFSQCNMMIMSKDNFDKYCSFIFSILEKTEEKIKLSQYTRQKRVFGYLAETLLGLWIIHNNKKTKQILIDWGKPTNSLKIFLNKLRLDISYRLSKEIKAPKDVYIPQPVKVGLSMDNIICNQVNYK